MSKLFSHFVGLFELFSLLKLLCEALMTLLNYCRNKYENWNEFNYLFDIWYLIINYNIIYYINCGKIVCFLQQIVDYFQIVMYYNILIINIYLIILIISISTFDIFSRYFLSRMYLYIISLFYFTSFLQAKWFKLQLNQS